MHRFILAAIFSGLDTINILPLVMPEVLDGTCRYWIGCGDHPLVANATELAHDVGVKTQNARSIAGAVGKRGNT